MATCVNCGAEFEIKQHGYKRVAINRIISEGVEVKDVLESVLDLEEEEITLLEQSSASNEGRYLCSLCFADVEKIWKRTEELKKFKSALINRRCRAETHLTHKEMILIGKRPRSALTPSKNFMPKTEKKAKKDHALHAEPRPTRSGPRCNYKRESFRNRAVGEIQDSKYRSAFRHLTKKSTTAKKDFLNVVQYWARQEISAYCRTSKYTSQVLTYESLKNFSWAKYFSETRESLPTLFAILEATVTTRGNEHKIKVDANGKLGPLAPGVGFVLGVLLHLKRRGRFRMVQSIISAQLYNEGCSQKLQTWLYKAGLCQSIWGTRDVIDRLVEEFDDDANVVKHSLEAFVSSEDVQKKDEEDWLAEDDESSEMIGDDWSEVEESSEHTEDSWSQAGESGSEGDSTSQAWGTMEESNDHSYSMEGADDVQVKITKKSRKSLSQGTSGE